MSDATVTVRQVLQLVLEAVSYPCIGNTDWADAAELEAQALAKVPYAIASPDDPPEFRRWLDTLSKPNRCNYDRDGVLDAMADYLDALQRKTFT
jgi:hypothetical protein